jgi:peroxiredoxin
MRTLILTFLLALATAGQANVVRSAPEFSWPGAGNSKRSLKSLRGQPVVLLFAYSPRTGAFRKQLKWLKPVYHELAAKGAVFIAAFRAGEEGAVKSDIPFIVANNGAGVASAYGVNGDFGLAIVGKDGNLDYITDKVRTGERIRDVIINNFQPQTEGRKQYQ